MAQTCGTLGLLLAYPGGAAGKADQVRPTDPPPENVKRFRGGLVFKAH